ncbi:MAG: hypothetical protein L3K15_07050 [Thermoplasmata archaeon]|nr:hypothetical protein [Thermoplasmata archaeon]
METSDPAPRKRNRLPSAVRPRLEGILVIGTVAAFTIVLALSVITVPAHFSTTVATKSTEQFRTNAQVTFHWQTSTNQPAALTLTNEYDNISGENGVSSPSLVVYQSTASSGSFSFVSDGAPYVFTCACSAAGAPTSIVQVDGTVATPLL